MSAPTLRLDGQAAVVTGASEGLGAIMARALADQGCAVLLAARRERELVAVTRTITAAGGRAAHIVADVRDPAHAGALVDACADRFGRIDGIVANAGITDARPAEDHDSVRFDEVLHVNVTAVAELCAAAARRMTADDRGGWMILLSSIVARRAGTGQAITAYTASKAAIDALTRELARLWAPRGIRVNAISPGVFPTTMNAQMFATPERRERMLARVPLGHLGEPADLAGPVAFLASDAARYVTGQVLGVDGGMDVW